MKPLVSSVRVERVGVHDIVHVWSRGGKAGMLTVAPGDGYAIAARLTGRAPAVSDTACDHESAADVVARELGNVREAVAGLAKEAHRIAAIIDSDPRQGLHGPGSDRPASASIHRADETMLVALGRLVAAVEALPR